MATERSKLNTKLDKLIKQIIYIRDDNTCQHCYKQVEGSNRHASHVIPVSAGNRLRWDENNLKVMCYHCHINWWHKNPLESGEWFRERFPERWEYLLDNRGIVKNSIADLEDLEKELKDKLNKLNH